ncbi:hypothetical protein HOV30_gp066 [Erwinia phage Derbicus]|uniref:Uncharacterized protein n=2 Tax=Derbicusvirus derbicus TaxID=2734104 RepID=A0A482IGN4_9CAUD|nr:hypothetical protein BIZ82_gp066 [Erwinia phage vB_EamM_EarlPhillipIV]YP_009821110.1 hypothetical protein HOV30_gp066 [Erwinia phage Derbicus]ANZ48916.1 hypothetical protein EARLPHILLIPIV_66 [Erwinia phage vB_EamM_EarlPhillipIV]QBP07492.1 hypothetical protein DERBICUS_66 [Erwinia phage Derbicus]QXO09787.1 hypothetical protein pEaSNUABM38_00065 [Erwinia phage pEa_SNUABM_38]
MKNDNLDMLLKLSGKELAAVMAQVKAEKAAGQRLPAVSPVKAYLSTDFRPNRILNKA